MPTGEKLQCVSKNWHVTVGQLNVHLFDMLARASYMLHLRLLPCLLLAASVCFTDFLSFWSENLLHMEPPQPSSDRRVRHSVETNKTSNA